MLLDGATREAFPRPDVLARSFVEPPQTMRLGEALSSRLPSDVLTVEEMPCAFETTVKAR